MTTTTFDMNDLKRRMQGAIASLKQELSGLRTGRASTALLEHVQVEAYGNHMPLNQLASISVPEPRLLHVQVWDRSMVHAVEKAISAANLGLTPSTEGQVLKLRIPELNEERRKEIAKVAHKYAEAARATAPTAPAMSPSSWMAMDAGPRPAACRAWKAIAAASRPCARRCARPTSSAFPF